MTVVTVVVGTSVCSLTVVVTVLVLVSRITESWVTVTVKKSVTSLVTLSETDFVDVTVLGTVVVTVWGYPTVVVMTEVVGTVVLQVESTVCMIDVVDVGPVATQEQNSVTSVSAIPTASVVMCVRSY